MRWRPVDQWGHQGIPRRWRGRLLDRGSLTRRLIAESGNHFAVEVLGQTLARPTPGEAQLLGMADRQQALVREVFLTGRGVPWVFARSILPLTTLSGRLRALRRLDERPLGALLFSDPTMRRGPLELARIPGAAIPRGQEADDARLWGRRSLFFLDDKPLLVAEIFLSGYKP